ncbi:intraflagellar transport protein 20 homolog isoform 3-T3 [Phoenicopterus ruber ruber]
MAQAALGAAGLHFDELNKLRVLDPEVAQQTAQLREECRAFLDKIVEFQKIVGSLIELVDQLAKAAESEKMKSVGPASNDEFVFPEESVTCFGLLGTL